MNAYTLYILLCKDLMAKPIITLEEYLSAVDLYLTISAVPRAHVNRSAIRHLQAVYHKHKRTSLISSDPNRYPLSLALAFRSHARIQSLVAGCQVRKSGVGRVEGHYSTRLLHGVMTDMFGYASRRLATLKAPFGRPSCAPKRLLSSSISSGH